MFWICAENSVDNTGMIFLIAEQCLHRLKGFSGPHDVPPARRLEVHQKLGGGTARTTDPNWPKGDSLPYDIVLSVESWRKKEEGGTIVIMAFVFPRNLYMPCFPGDGWTPACWWEVVN